MGEVKKKGRGLVLPAFPEHVTLISKKHRQGLNFAVLCTLHGYVLVSIDNDVLTRIISKTAKSVLLSICHPHRHVFRESRLQAIAKEPWASQAKMSRLLKVPCSLKNRGKSAPYIARIFRIYDWMVFEFKYCNYSGTIHTIYRLLGVI